MRWSPDGELAVVYETGRRPGDPVRAALRRRHDHRDRADQPGRRAGVRARCPEPLLGWPGERVHRLPRRGPRLLRRPRGRQHQVVLGEAQGDVRRVREGADDRAVRRARAGVRRREGVPALPRRAVRQGQDAVQDPPGRVRRGRPGDRLVRRGLRARRPHRRRLLRGELPSGWPRSARRSTTTAPAPSSSGSSATLDDGRLGDRRRPAQDQPARVRRRPPADRAAAPQVAGRSATRTASSR